MTNNDFIELCCTTIGSVLDEFLPQKQVSEAVTLWRQRFSTGPVVAVQPFVALLCEKYQLTAKRSNLYFALMNKLTVLRAQQRQQQGTKLQEQGLGELHYAGQAFVALLTRVLAKVGARDLSKKYWLVESLHFPGREGTIMSSTEMWQDFLLDGKKTLPFELSLGQMKALVLQLQRKLRELLGVQACDMLLAEVLQDLEALPQHRFFSARNLF